jgi:hypothetical protein
VADLDADPQAPCRRTVRNRFGHWNAAVEAAGFESREQGSGYTREGILGHIRRLADGDEPPTSFELKDDPDAPDTVAIRNHFGHWNAAVEAAGFEPRRAGRPVEEGQR